MQTIEDRSHKRLKQVKNSLKIIASVELVINYCFYLKVVKKVSIEILINSRRFNE